MENNNKTKIYGIALIIILVVAGYILFNKQTNEHYYIDLVSRAMKQYDSRANFDITATTSNAINQVIVRLTPSDNYTTNKYGSFYVEYNLKSKNVIRTSSYDIPLKVFE